MTKYRPLAVCLGLIVLDQASKALARSKLMHLGNIPMAPFFSLTYIENTGVSFGMLQNVPGVWLLAVNSVLTVALYAYWRRQQAQEGAAFWGLLLIIAGAVGNLLDRMTLGYVVDFFDFKVWPVFNFADSMITIGVGVYIAGSILDKKNRKFL